MMRYQPGDLVYPADLPRRVLCRVVATKQIASRDGGGQALRLKPVSGQPWHPPGVFVRLNAGVLPVRLGDLWRAGLPPRPVVASGRGAA
jgi:hypothetical protein